MSDFKNRLKESQQGAGAGFPRLPIIHNVEPKENGADVEFQIYDKEAKANVAYEQRIEGIFIGTAMQLSSYSDNLGPNGGQYKSDFYIKNDNVTLFGPTPKGYSVMCHGTMDQIEVYISTNSTGTAKKRQVILVLTEAGLVAVITNLSIAIDQINAVKEQLMDNMIVLTPKLFSEADPKISKKAKEYLGKFRQKNPPKYAEVNVGSPITEELFNRLGTDSVIDQFAAWKKWKESGGAIKEEKVEEKAEEQKATWTPKQEASNALKTNELDDDLPF